MKLIFLLPALIENQNPKFCKIFESYAFSWFMWFFNTVLTTNWKGKIPRQKIVNEQEGLSIFDYSDLYVVDD